MDRAAGIICFPIQMGKCPVTRGDGVMGIAKTMTPPSAGGLVTSRETPPPPHLNGEESDSAQRLSILRAAMKADCGISTSPICRMRFLPFFCFSRSFFLRLMSPP